MKNSKLETAIKNDEKNSVEQREAKFLEMKLDEYVKSNTRFEKNYVGKLEQDYTSRKNSLLTEYILNNFTLREVFIIFCEYSVMYTLERNLIILSKQDSIKCINDSHELTEQERNRLKKKVWDMPKILYGLVHELIHLSNLFVREDGVGSEFPDLSNMMN